MAFSLNLVLIYNIKHAADRDCDWRSARQKSKQIAKHGHAEVRNCVHKSRCLCGRSSRRLWSLRRHIWLFVLEFVCLQGYMAICLLLACLQVRCPFTMMYVGISMDTKLFLILTLERQCDRQSRKGQRALWNPTVRWNANTPNNNKKCALYFILPSTSLDPHRCRVACRSCHYQLHLR